MVTHLSCEFDLGHDFSERVVKCLYFLGAHVAQWGFDRPAP